MKKLACCTAVAMALALTVSGRTPAQAPSPAQPGTPAPAAQPRGAPPPTAVAPPPRTVKKAVVRKRRVRTRGGSDNIANRLNAQELAGAGHAGAMAPHGAYGAPYAAYGAPRPVPVAGPAYPPPPFYRPPPPPVWYPPPPRPWFGWRPWPFWRPWRPYLWW